MTQNNNKEKEIVSNEEEDITSKFSPKTMKALLEAGKKLLSQVEQASPPSPSPSSESSSKQIGGKS